MKRTWYSFKLDFWNFIVAPFAIGLVSLMLIGVFVEKGLWGIFWLCIIYIIFTSTKSIFILSRNNFYLSTFPYLIKTIPYSQITNINFKQNTAFINGTFTKQEFLKITYLSKGKTKYGIYNYGKSGSFLKKILDFLSTKVDEKLIDKNSFYNKYPYIEYDVNEKSRS